MNLDISSLFLLFFPLSISALNVFESRGGFALKNTACDIHGDSLIGSFPGIENIGDCRQLCYNDDDCEFITYYGDNGFPIRNFCEIFKSCDDTVSCSECISETKGCYKPCSKNIIGAIDANLLEMIPNIESENDCRELCGEKSGCEFYTFFLDSLLWSLFPPFLPGAPSTRLS